MNYFYLILLAIAPGIALVLFILLNDRYDREPTGLLVKIFLMGMLVTLPTIVVELLGQTFNVFTGLLGKAVEAFIVVGLAEEYFKRRVVLRYAYYHPAFNEKLDGIVYCSIAALGFATLENIFYVISYYTIQPNLWITRALLSVPAHMLLGIIMGYYLALAKYCPDPGKCRGYMAKSLLIPALLHGAFDFVLISEYPLLSLLFIPIVAYLWVTSLIKLRRYYVESRQLHGG
jgi:RsiW-degrading membrane proteinase PrsW (M82 family)